MDLSNRYPGSGKETLPRVKIRAVGYRTESLLEIQVRVKNKQFTHGRVQMEN